jgi:hypothetical protein
VPHQPGNPIKNAGFEAGPVDWVEFSSHGYNLIIQGHQMPSGTAPHGGNWAVWLGGDNNEVSSITQQVTIPNNASYLTYWHWIGSSDDCGFDVAGVLIDGDVPTGGAYWLCADNNTYGWEQFGVSLAPWAGQNVELKILVGTDGSAISGLLLDDVALGSGSKAPDMPAMSPAEQAKAADRLKELLP